MWKKKAVFHQFIFSQKKNREMIESENNVLKKIIFFLNQTHTRECDRKTNFFFIFILDSFFFFFSLNNLSVQTNPRVDRATN